MNEELALLGSVALVLAEEPTAAVPSEAPILRDLERLREAGLP